VSITYQAAGVNLEAAEEATHQIAALAKSTFNSQVLREIGRAHG